MAKSATAYTSDGEERANVKPFATAVLATVPYDIDDNGRVSALYNVGTYLKSAGQSINAISQFAAYPNNDVTQRLNDIITAANAAGASPVLKTYISTDYNAFTSIINNTIAAVNALGLPGNTAAPVASATSLSVAGAGVASVTNGTWSNTPTSYTYQWYRGGTAIAGATTNSHTLVSADIGFILTCTVTAVNAAGYVAMTSNAIGPMVA